MDGAALIDLHCHILPALDDGALDMSDSVAMAREAARDGIEVVCATPHIRSDHDVRIEQLPERIEELQGQLDARGVPVRIAQGAEISQLSAETLSDRHLRTLSLGGGGWILLEPASGPIAERLPALAGELAARTTGVIVAHPERHAGTNIVQQLCALRDRGCLLQWTADFVARADPEDPGALVLRLAREGLVHLLSSDAHSSHGGRPLKLRAGFDRLRAVCTPEQVAWMAEVAPAAILRGELLTPPW
ncbi:MAG TPA: CpsB/CapC family capsule biosynthesis tyrosine phosphatase [Solirubrobacteraceae bacterium]|nr:CpsB/CapC family capsule biosynthesis tyrosine phosphatase [Solirubrobacteraceae bacterium]